MLSRNHNVIQQIVEKSIQMLDVQKHWPNNSVSVSAQGLVRAIGAYESKNFKHKYKYVIFYNLLSGEVKCWITDPVIIKNEFIHMNHDNSLCLYHYRDYSVFKRFLIGSEIVPWTIDWIYKYEEYLVNGNIWKGKEASHG